MDKRTDCNSSIVQTEEPFGVGAPNGSSNLSNGEIKVKLMTKDILMFNVCTAKKNLLFSGQIKSPSSQRSFTQVTDPELNQPLSP